jgi:hypothetical protein
VLVCSLRTPNNSGGCTGRIKTSVGSVTFVGITELTVDLRVRLWRKLSLAVNFERCDLGNVFFLKILEEKHEDHITCG